MQNHITIPILGIVAYSGTGKTTLLEKVIPILKQNGLRIGLIKHAHHRFDIDHPGKDSYRLRKAGCQQTLVASKARWALITESINQQEPKLEDLVTKFNQQQLDLILVEGFKHETMTKIALCRNLEISKTEYELDPNVIAIASDNWLNQHSNKDKLDLNKPSSIAEYILRLVSKQLNKECSKHV